MPDKDLNVRKRIFYAQLIAYVLIISVASYGFWQIGNILDDQARSQTCTEEFLGTTVAALNERTTYSTQQANANIELQKAQLKFLSVISKPGDSGDAALNEYVDALQNFFHVTALTAGKAESNPYPTREDYRMCLAGKD
jgi:hypothetical protein